MKANPDDQKQLLQVQQLDTRLEQLQHRLANLPQNAELVDLAKREDAIRLSRADAIGTLDGARRDLERSENDIAVVETRIVKDTERLTTSSSVKDVAALETELATLRKRLTDLEDNELEIMERVELAEKAVAAIDVNSGDIANQRAKLVADRDAATNEISEELLAAKHEREIQVNLLPESLVQLYEKRRARSGIGAALLRQQCCGGCTITINGVDLERIRKAAPDEVIECPECDRILVRTEESGL